MKQIIVIRADVGMGRGKACAQVAHASIEAYKQALSLNRQVVRAWELEGSKKVVLKAESLEELLAIYDKATSLGLPCALIRDAGLTQLPPGTITALAIGPSEDSVLDRITGHLKLF